MLMTAKHDKVILKSRCCVSDSPSRERWDMRSATYRISKRLYECLPVTVLKGLKDGMSGSRAQGRRRGQLKKSSG